MTELIPKETMDTIKSSLESYLKKFYPSLADRISIHLDQRLQLVEVQPGMFTLSDEDYERIHKQKAETRL